MAIADSLVLILNLWRNLPMFRRTCLLLAIVFTVCTATHAEAARRTSPLELTLPRACYAVVGVPMSIYYDNIVLTEKPEDYHFAVQCDLGTAETRRWTVTPKPHEIGVHPLSISVSDSQGKVLERGKMVLHVVPANSGQGRKIRLLIVGDSLTHATVYPNEIARLLSGPGNPDWTMLGTHRPSSAAKGVAHEGYGGWTWQRFVSCYVAKPDPAKRQRSSPFVFATASRPPQLDVPHYFETSCSGQRPDFITIMLGINDCFSANPEDPAAIDARVKAMFTQADTLIGAFRRAAPKAEIGICLTTPPNARESGFEANYHGRYHRWGWKRIQHRLVQHQLARYAHRDAHVFVVPTELNLDPVAGYPENNGVHPNKTGYEQIGTAIYAWLKSRLGPVKP